MATIELSVCRNEKVKYQSISVARRLDCINCIFVFFFKAFRYYHLETFIKEEGLALWYTVLGCHLQQWHSIWALV